MVRPALLGLRLSEQEDAALKAAAEAQYQKTTDFARLALLAFADMNPAVRDQLQGFAQRLGLRMGMVLEAIVTRYFAERETMQQVWGELANLPDPEFTIVNGLMLSGENLRQVLRQHFLRSLAAARERDILYNWHVHGNEPTAEEAAFLVTDGPQTREATAIQSALAQQQAEAATLKALHQHGYDLTDLPTPKRRALMVLWPLVHNGTLTEETFAEQLELLRSQAAPPPAHARGLHTTRAEE